MIQRLIFLTVFALLAPACFATTLMKCHIRGSLQGDPQFAWSTGRDAWQGKGVIECARMDRPQVPAWRTEVILRYESFENGAGAGPDSTLEFFSNAIYTDSPLDLTRRFVLKKERALPKTSVTLVSHSKDGPCRFSVRGDTDTNTVASLSIGSLEVFVPQFSPGQ
jgi:hypothetical protein